MKFAQSYKILILFSGEHITEQNVFFYGPVLNFTEYECVFLRTCWLTLAAELL